MSTITANLTSSRSVTGSFAQSSQPQVVRVTVPGPQGPTGSSASTLQTLSDVDVSTLNDGALLQYKASTNKVVARTTIDTTAGDIVLSGGSF
mgnify:CR=1 FL=1